MVYRLIALNIDGTLLRDNARMTRQTKEAIEYVKNKGVYVTLATARPYLSALKIAKALKLNSYLITSNGAFVASTTGDPIFIRRINDEEAIQMIHILERYKCQIRVVHESYSIRNKIERRSNLIAKMTFGSENPLLNPITFVDSISEQLQKKPMNPLNIQVQFLNKQDQEAAIQQIEQSHPEIKMIETNTGRVDFVRERVSKARGLQVLGKHLRIHANEMVAIGAADSAREMVSYAGLGVAMGNATDSVKNVADWITRSNEQNGVSYMIHELFRKQLRVQL